MKDAAVFAKESALWVLPGLFTALTAVLFALCFLRYVLTLLPDAPKSKWLLMLWQRMGRGAYGPAEAQSPLEKGQWQKILLYVTLVFLISRVVMVAAGQIGAYFMGEIESLWEVDAYRYVRWDAYHYLRLADNWYVTEGDPRFHIVFFPLYPLLVRLVKPLFLGNTLACAFTLSALMHWGSGVMLYKLVRMQGDEMRARLSVFALMFFPTSAFFSAPYGESLFVLLTLLCVYMARRRRFWLSVFFGALSANTRVLGVLCAVPVFYEMMRAAGERAGDGKTLRRIVGYALMTSLIAAGLLAYIGLNYQITGNPFQFLIYQREHWGQRFGNILNTLSYTVALMLENEDIFDVLGIWLPQFAFYALFAVGLFCTAFRTHPADGAYAWLYAVVAYAPTWLLSGPRYMMGMYAIYPMLAMLPRKKGGQVALILVMTALFAVYSILYYAKGSVL